MIIVVAASAVMLVSCAQEGTALFKGNYSFKTSGNVSIVRDEAFLNDTTFNIYTEIPEGSSVPVVKVDTVVTVHDETLKVMIDNEAGQMDITEMDSSTGDMLLTMNITGGEMVAYYAVAKDGAMTITPAERHMKLVSGAFSVFGGESVLDGGTVMADIRVSGSGKKYDNIVIFDLDYSGDLTVGGILYHIVDSDVICRAKVNE